MRPEDPRLPFRGALSIKAAPNLILHRLLRLSRFAERAAAQLLFSNQDPLRHAAFRNATFSS